MPNLAAERKLLAAAESGDLASVRNALAHGADVNARNRNGETALFCAVWNGHLAVVDHLIEQHADLNQVDSRNGDSPLHRAMNNPFPVFDRLLDAGADVNVQDHARKTPLMYTLGKPHQVKRLLDAGANPNHQAGAQGNTVLTALLGPLSNPFGKDDPVARVAQKGLQHESLSLLLAAGANPNAVDGHGRTPLGDALTYRWPVAAIERLLDAGADLDQVVPAWKKTPRAQLPDHPQAAAAVERRELRAFVEQEGLRPDPEAPLVRSRRL